MSRRRAKAGMSAAAFMAGFSSAGRLPLPVLDASKLYFGDNGRVHCGALRCAGNSAHFTGRTIAGQRVKPTTADDARAFTDAGLVLKCETCGCGGAVALPTDGP